MMKSCILLMFLIYYFVLGKADVNLSTGRYGRVKRSASGALDIVTNHADPIHADVKSEGEGSEKPCPKSSGPSRIESGAGFKVIPPENIVYPTKSLRKSLPVYTASPTALDWMRSINRIVTLIILFVSASLEFFPAIQSLAMYIYNFITNQ